MASRIEEWTDKLAELAVFGANVQPGQLVGVTSYIGKEALTRRIAHFAYKRGAKYVDVVYFDQWVKRERIAHAAEEHARLRAAVDVGAAPLPLGRARGAHHAVGPTRADGAGGARFLPGRA